MPTQIAVIGGSEAAPPQMAAAEAIGAALASAGAIVVCGGLGGVMAASCRGAKAAGGLTVGILPGDDPSAANQWVDVAIATGLGEARNALVVGSAAVVIAVDGEYGTLSEIALALRAGTPVVGVGTWSLARP
ncbi:MAG TPA: TIGR00725 family protein, partial [Acidimicrobiales bacterium]|nr:TIGR00725 family protein [Acidimicrobiales bacterium]